jgi:hypothetical protein
MIDFQSLAFAPWPCPLGTSENSQPHARVIYGWFYSPHQTQSPEGTAEIPFCHVGSWPFQKKFVFIGVHPWLKLPLWHQNS